ncbi:type II secretion system protein N [Candidatus Sororendozoicomonas aggregata]|uniref:type II secretion system protein N n=1 Tax=Candidatus Sororendozoicomonas aggregata TaxID=3073239 RepID=UPI002ED13E9E
MNLAVANAFIQWGLRHYRQIITVIFLVVFTALIFQQSYGIYAESVYKNKLIKQKEIYNAGASNSNKSLVKLSDFDLLFGSSQRKDTQKSPSDIPKTQLNLALLGALGSVKGGASGKGSAIIQSNNMEKVYQVGDKLPGGATLSEVHSTHVVINRDGHLEKLAFPKPGPAASGLKPVTPSHASVNDDYTMPSNSESLEWRMLRLREQLQKAEQ